MKNIEYHPFNPFLPIDSQILIQGSFPPKRDRWSMEFYYPNYQNDMWRILGLIFFDDKDYFVIEDKKTFNLTKLKEFLAQKGIALSDTAHAVVRHKDNASDKFLEVIETVDEKEILRQIKLCKAVVTTGEKATETLSDILQVQAPKIGNFSDFTFDDRAMRFYRMPSSSRAYPKSLKAKSEVYKEMFAQLGML